MYTRRVATAPAACDVQDSAQPRAEFTCIFNRLVPGNCLPIFTALGLNLRQAPPFLVSGSGTSLRKLLQLSWGGSVSRAQTVVQLQLLSAPRERPSLLEALDLRSHMRDEKALRPGITMAQSPWPSPLQVDPNVQCELEHSPSWAIELQLLLTLTCKGGPRPPPPLILQPCSAGAGETRVCLSLAGGGGQVWGRQWGSQKGQLESGKEETPG